jgi:hypothetical protein
LIAGQIHHVRRQIRMSILEEHDDAAQMPIDHATFFRVTREQHKFLAIKFYIEPKA